VSCKHSILKLIYEDGQGVPYYKCADCDAILEIQLCRVLDEDFLITVFHVMKPETVVELLQKVATEDDE
jgi:hypothetical protein